MVREIDECENELNNNGVDSWNAFYMFDEIEPSNQLSAVWLCDK